MRAKCFDRAHLQFLHAYVLRVRGYNKWLSSRCVRKANRNIEPPSVVCL